LQKNWRPDGGSVDCQLAFGQTVELALIHDGFPSNTVTITIQ